MNELVSIPHGDFHPLGLSLPEGLGEIEWKRVGHGLMRAQKGLQFAIGDWINYGEKAYGKTYELAIQIFGIEGNGSYGYEEQTLRVFAHVAGRVKLLTRINNLNWKHHRSVSRFESEEEQAIWLKKAVENKWSSRDLSKAIREAFGEYAEEDEKPIADGGVFTLESWFSEYDRNSDDLFSRKPISKWSEREIRKRLEKLDLIRKPIIEEAKSRGMEVIQ